MNKAPAFQFYVNDWLSSPSVAMMTPAQEGAYIRLLCYDWASDGIPDDDEVLASLSRLGEGWFKGGCDLVRKCFNQHPTKAGYLTNDRIQKEREKQRIWREKSAEGGRKSGEKRSEKQSKSKGGSRVGGTKREPKSNTSSSTSSSLSSSSSNIWDGLPDGLNHDDFKTAWTEYIEYRKEKKLTPLLPRSVVSQWKECAGWGRSTAIAAIQQTIRKGYQGIFPPKNGERPAAKTIALRPDEEPPILNLNP